MRLPDFDTTINLDVEGEVTKTKWLGQFTIKRVLTHKDRFEIERFFREYLPMGMEADQNLRTRAAALAELRVRIKHAPRWWEDSNYGLDMVDSEPIYYLLIKSSESYKKWQDELAEMIKEPPKAE